MNPWMFAAPAIGANLGVLKSELIDRPRATRQKQLNAEITRYSPWTNMQQGEVQEADPFGSALQFGTTGAMMGQNFASAGDASKLNAAKIANLEADTASMGGMNRRPSSRRFSISGWGGSGF